MRRGAQGRGKFHGEDSREIRENVFDKWIIRRGEKFVRTKGLVRSKILLIRSPSETKCGKSLPAYGRRKCIIRRGITQCIIREKTKE